MTALVSVFCFGVVVTLIGMLGVVEAREFRKREWIAAVARAEKPAAGADESSGLRAFSGSRSV